MNPATEARLLTARQLFDHGFTARRIYQLVATLTCGEEGCPKPDEKVGFDGWFRLREDGVTGACAGCAGKIEAK